MNSSKVNVANGSSQDTLSIHQSHPGPALEAEKSQAGSLRGTRFHWEPETKSQLTEHEVENKKVTGHLGNSLNIIDGSGNNYIVV